MRAISRTVAGCLEGFRRSVVGRFCSLQGSTYGPPANLQKEGAAYEAFTKSIVDSGKFLDGDPFEPTASAQTVEVRGGKTQSRKGPADTAKLQLGAYYKVEAKSPEEAAEMASRIPGATYGSIEVRPIWDFS